MELLQRMVAARGALPEEGRRRLQRIEALFEAKPERVTSGQPATA